jgi:hypothetical protein
VVALCGLMSTCCILGIMLTTRGTIMLPGVLYRVVREDLQHHA